MTLNLLADAILLFHAAYVAYVVLGLVAIVVGIALNWNWVRNFWFRITHLAAIGLVVTESLVGLECPLTVLENRLRQAAGQRGYAAGCNRSLGTATHILRLSALDVYGWLRAFASGGRRSLLFRPPARPGARRNRLGGVGAYRRSR